MKRLHKSMVAVLLSATSAVALRVEAFMAAREGLPGACRGVGSCYDPNYDLNQVAGRFCFVSGTIDNYQCTEKGIRS